jgi:hypothetical protein
VHHSRPLRADHRIRADDGGYAMALIIDSEEQIDLLFADIGLKDAQTRRLFGAANKRRIQNDRHEIRTENTYARRMARSA